MANNLIQGTTNISDISEIDIKVTSKDGTKSYAHVDSNIAITSTHFTNGMVTGSWVINPNADKKDLVRQLHDHLTQEKIGVVCGCSQSLVSQAINSVNHEERENIMPIPQEQTTSVSSQSEDEYTEDDAYPDEINDIDDGNYWDEEE